MKPHITIPAHALKIGMFVSKLDRPWLETPFSLEGLWVRSPEDISQLMLYCDKVSVDPNKSWLKVLDEEEKAKKSKCAGNDRAKTSAEQGQDKKLEDEERHQVSFAEEIAVARNHYDDTDASLRTLMNDIDHQQSINMEPIKTSISNMMGSIHRNPDALLWLSLLKSRDSYTYQHCLDVSIHLMNFGKYLKLPKDQQYVLGLAGLLQDIGKMKLSEEIINKRGQLTIEEKKLTQKHVRYTLEILSEYTGIPEQSIEIIEQHHERFDGLGYPKGLRGNQISTFAAMSSIIDTYNALISDRPTADSCSSNKAISVLYDGKGKSYHPALVERFIQCIGVYSPGTVVQLNTDELAIVIEQNKTRRLQPKILVIFDAEQQPYAAPYVVDLLTQGNIEQKSGYRICDTIEPGKYDIDLSDYYL